MERNCLVIRNIERRLCRRRLWTSWDQRSSSLGKAPFRLLLLSLPMANKSREAAYPAVLSPKLLFIMRNSRGVNPRPQATSNGVCCVITGTQINHSEDKSNKQNHKLALSQNQLGGKGGQWNTTTIRKTNQENIPESDWSVQRAEASLLLMLFEMLLIYVNPFTEKSRERLILD